MLKKLIGSSSIIKITSVIIGFCFWFILSDFRPIEIAYTVPISFYNDEQYTIEAPETITVQLKGYKTDLYAADLTSLTAMIDLKQLHEGTNHIILTEENLFLPSEIKLVHYSPLNIVVMVKNKKLV